MVRSWSSGSPRTTSPPTAPQPNPSTESCIPVPPNTCISIAVPPPAGAVSRQNNWPDPAYERQSRSLRLDVGRPDHLRPLLGFFGNEFAEVGERHRHRHAAKVGKARLDLGIERTCGRRAYKLPALPTRDLVGDEAGLHGWTGRKVGKVEAPTFLRGPVTHNGGGRYA